MLAHMNNIPTQNQMDKTAYIFQELQRQSAKQQCSVINHNSQGYKGLDFKGTNEHR